MNVDQARETLAGLELKLSEASAKAVENATERQRISFDALSGDEAAQKRLDKLNAQSGIIAIAIENAKSAVEEGRRRLAEAEHGEERGRLAENAEAALLIANRMAERGERLDAAFANVAADLAGLREDFDGMHALGLSHPRLEHLRVNAGLAIVGKLQALPIKAADRDFLAPHERRSFEQLTTAWHESVARWAGQFIKQDEAA
jgi:hypothetical protein